MTFNSLLRNKIAVLTVLCATVLFSACGSDTLSDPLTRADETYVGEFKSLGGIEVQDVITHLFETEDGDVLYAYSERYDLDSSDYDGVNVEAYGMVTTHEDLDKPLFEVQRITDAPEEDEDSKEVTMIDYQDPDLGFSMSYPSNWTMHSELSTVSLEAPAATEDAEDDDMIGDAETPAELRPAEEPEMIQTLDIIVISQLDADLLKTSEDTQEDRATEVRSYVTSHYASLSTTESELAYVGTDRLLSVRYKTANGDVFYFIPRAEKLYELSYNHESDSDTDRLENSNTFASLVSGFRFTPYGAAPEPSDELEESEETPVEEPKETSTPTEGQVTFNSYRELESKPYEFKMSYPGNWYYAGSSTGYTFSDTSTDDENSEAILTMTFNGKEAVGLSRSGETVSVTVEVEGRKYTISGPAEYQSAMQTMADSITSTATDDEE